MKMAILHLCNPEMLHWALEERYSSKHERQQRHGCVPSTRDPFSSSGSFCAINPSMSGVQVAKNSHSEAETPVQHQQLLLCETCEGFCFCSTAQGSLHRRRQKSNLWENPETSERSLRLITSHVCKDAANEAVATALLQTAQRWTLPEQAITCWCWQSSYTKFNLMRADKHHWNQLNQFSVAHKGSNIKTKVKLQLSLIRKWMFVHKRMPPSTVSWGVITYPGTV